MAAAQQRFQSCVNCYIVRMPPQPSSASPPRLALFDLDGTLTWRDTLSGFLAGYARRHPATWLRLWRLPFVLASYLIVDRDRGALKAGVIRIVMGGETRARIDAWADTFVAGLARRGTFRPAALAVLEGHRAAGDHLVLLSASPDLYVPRIGRLLGFERTLCTEIRWRAEILDGALATPNRYGAEKSSCLAWLRLQYPGATVMAYGNSASDLPHLQQADGALLVNASAAARRQAASLGLPVAQWTGN
jgi:phosphatidylglycerophosphatase C